MDFDLVAALDWTTTALWWIDVVLKVAIGLGAVIFVHELGHFLVAKACGVKVEKFMIGFDIGGYKISWRRGETEYGIGILPLGGYVKMLGQDDDPAHIAEQMQKSQVTPGSAEAVEITGPNGEKYLIDRRSYLAKSVPQRMAIISAGVIMNVIFAFIFATIAYGMGVSYLPCIISETVPGSPAWQAGLEPGDEIVQVGDRVNPTFTQLRGGVTLGDLENGIESVVSRAENGEEVSLILKPTQSSGRLATIGILSYFTLTVADVIDDSAAARAKLVSIPPGVVVDDAKLMAGDEIIRVGESEVVDYRELCAELAKLPEQAVRITVRRQIEKGGKTADNSPQNATMTHELEFELPPQPRNWLRAVMKMGPITAIQSGSPAERAGLKIGDVIETVDGKTNGTAGPDSWDAEALADYFAAAAREGREVEIAVARSTGSDPAPEAITVRLKPQVSIQLRSPFPARLPGTPMAADEIGIAYRIQNEVERVADDSTDSAAALAPGDKVLKAKIVYPKNKDGQTPDAFEVELGPDQPNWPTLADALQFVPPGTVVELSVSRDADSAQDAAARRVKLTPVVAENSFLVARGFWLKPYERTRRAETFAEQVRQGWDETAEALTMVYRFLQKLGTQVPLTALGGPVTIAKAAGYSAAEGISSLLIFLTMLSANLAVVNFLPIPLLDGGHMVFLAYEWIRGRPANERFVIALHTAGFVFIVTLMLYVLALDFNLIDRNL
jgi:regulator of sigma E protease